MYTISYEFNKTGLLYVYVFMLISLSIYQYIYFFFFFFLINIILILIIIFYCLQIILLHHCDVMQIYARADSLTVRCLKWFYWRQCNFHSYNGTIILLTLCMRFMHTSRISSGVISAGVNSLYYLFDTIRFLLPCNSHYLVETPLCRLARTME